MTFAGSHLTSITDSKVTNSSEVYVSLDLRPFKNRTNSFLFCVRMGNSIFYLHPVWKGRFPYASFLLSELSTFASEGFKILLASLKRIFRQAWCQRLPSIGGGGGGGV